MRFIVLFVLMLCSLNASAGINSVLQGQLLNMANQSQQIRHSLTADGSGTNDQALKILALEITAVHNQTLKQIVSLHGWPTEQLVGKQGVNAAFQLVLHSTDLTFQQDMLPLIIQSYINQEGIAGPDVAELTDQVSLKQGKKQVFGTQTLLADGKLILAPIENEQAVNQLRAQMKLPPLVAFEK